jgi:hypothetical protein
LIFWLVFQYTAHVLLDLKKQSAELSAMALGKDSSSWTSIVRALGRVREALLVGDVGANLLFYVTLSPVFWARLLSSCLWTAVSAFAWRADASGDLERMRRARAFYPLIKYADALASVSVLLSAILPNLR